MQTLHSRYLIPVTAIVTFLGAFLLLSHLAMGDPLPTPDAGPVAVAASTAATATPVAVPDPIEDPAGAYDALRNLWHTSHVLVVLAGLLMGLRIASKRVAWLRVGWRVTAIAGSTALLGTLIDTWPNSTGKLTTWLVTAALGTLLMLFRAEGEKPGASA